MQLNSLPYEPVGKTEWILRLAPLLLPLLIDYGRTVFGIPGKFAAKDGVGLPTWLSGKESACQCRKLGFNPWVEKMF